MSRPASSIERFIAQGRFGDALAVLSERESTGNAAITLGERIEFTELLERTGQLAKATAALAMLRESKRLSDSERARCMLVEGLVAKQKGHLEKAIGVFKQACRMAERAGSLELLCWCQLRLLGVLADSDGVDFEASHLADLRRNTEAAAVPAVSVAHQIFLAEYFAKRGDLDGSCHHGSLAESLLHRYPNLWLQGLLDLHLSCLAYLQGNYLDSLTAARDALDRSRESGHSLTGLIAQADMAAAYLAVGQPARGRVCLLDALRRANKEEQIFGLLVETLAETQLVSGDLSGCIESLRLARDLSATLSQSRSFWHRSWNLRTEVRLLQRNKQWQESLSLIRDSGLSDSADSRNFLKTQLEMLEAVALTRLGLVQEARGVIRHFVQQELDSSRRCSGSFATAAAVVLAASEPLGRSFSEGVSALRIVGATGETSSVVEVVDQCVDLIQRSNCYHAEHSLPDTGDPLWRPTHVVCHLDAATKILAIPNDDFRRLLGFVNSLADLTTDPESLGEESLRFLASMKWIRRGVVVESTEETRRAVTHFDCRAQRASSVTTSERPTDGVIRVNLGSRRSRRYELLLEPGDSDTAILNCFSIARTLSVLSRVNLQHDLAERSERPQGEPSADDSEGVFRSPAMLALLASAKRVAPLDISVLLTGESGTGKEVIARIIHEASGLPRDAFIAFNCATLPSDMVDGQLFGYRRGAFTGAVQGFKGVLSAAAGGTLLLDEVGELPLDTQPKLLRFLDSGEIQPLGEAVPRKIKVRVIAATNANLEELVQQGRFREDLYYRLNVVRFRLPPLRERREEVGPLISLFLSRYSLEFGKHNVRLSDAAWQHLLLSAWPGNIRQLSHEIRRLVALSEPDCVIDAAALDGVPSGQPPERRMDSFSGSGALMVRIDGRLSESVREIEDAALKFAIKASKGNLELAARRLGLSRKGLYLKRRRLGFPGPASSDRQGPGE